MLIIQKRKELKKYLDKERNKNSVGFIPTMGSIHQGHLSLIKNSKKRKLLTCVSIFINPLQFNSSKDFKSYPKNKKRDLIILKKIGCDLVFIPSTKEIYQKKIKSKKRVKKYRNILCDVTRPGHFDGVTTVVSKLLKLIKPNFVFFGEKDFQQLKIIEDLVKIENIKSKIIACNSIRYKNGMSLSSRYNLFNNEQKIKFRNVSKLFLYTLKEIKNGKDIGKSISNCITSLKKKGIMKIDYIEVRKNKNLNLTKSIKNARLFIAIFIDDIRIIDNFLL